MDLTFQIDASGFPAYAENKLDQLNEAFTAKLDRLSEELQRRIKGELSGGILQSRSGKAANSVEILPAAQSGDIIEGGVSAGGDLAPYLIFQEEGTKGPYTIRAKGKALAFMLSGKLSFFKSVQHPGLPARRPVGQTFDAMKDEILAGLQAVPGEVAAL